MIARLLEFLSSEPYRSLLYLVGICAFVAANAAYLVWVERKGAGRFQRRPGPTESGWAGLLQPPADGIKLLSKQITAPPDSDKILFWAAPLMVIAPPLVCLAAIPFGDTVLARNLNIGLLLVFSFGSINVMALMIGGWASRNKYAIISSARVVSQNVAYEIPMLLVVITLIMVTGTMNLQEIIEKLDLTLLTEQKDFQNTTPTGGYSSDLLSCVMAGAKTGNLWITLQAHINIVAVAALSDIAAVIITENAQPPDDVIEKANQQGVTLLSTSLGNYQVAGQLWDLGLW